MRRRTVGGVAYNAYNATQRDRFSTFDITSEHEESDPFADALGHGSAPRASDDEDPRFEGAYCPYCGHGVRADFSYCPKCGRDI